MQSPCRDSQREQWWLLLWKYFSGSKEQCDSQALQLIPSLQRSSRVTHQSPQLHPPPALPCSHTSLWSSPRQGAASPDSLERQKENPTPSSALPLSSRGCLPRKGTGGTWHRPQHCWAPLRGMRFAPPAKWVKPRTASLPAAASALPPDLPLSFILVIQAMELQQLSHCFCPQHQQSHRGVQDKSPSSGHCPRIWAG